MKKTSTKKGMPPKPKPRLKWQTGAYDHHAEYRFILPYQFLLLCKLMDVTPERVVIDFMDNLSHAGWKRQGRDKPKEHLVDYFVAHGYGQQHYTEEEIRRIFKEMDAVGLLFPINGKRKMLDAYVQWRSKHHTYWFKQWYKKPRRQLTQNARP